MVSVRSELKKNTQVSNGRDILSNWILEVWYLKPIGVVFQTKYIILHLSIFKERKLNVL